MAKSKNLIAGARNLLTGCLGLEAGQSLLIVEEDGAERVYDAVSAGSVAEEARRLGARVSSLALAPIAGPEDLPQRLVEAMGQADHTVFFSPIGDQIRFDPIPGAGRKTMCYALDGALLGSSFCTTPHGLTEAVKARFEAALDSAREWRITCPLGTDARGRIEPEDGADGPDDFSLGLFPTMISRPISCRHMTGRVALGSWLMGTGTHVYEPDIVTLDAPVAALVEDGRIAGFEGPADTVAAVRAHYRHVAELLELDETVVHSWHAGINPKTFSDRPAAADVARWGMVAFASPRYLHFHTCGDYAPGEIAWSVIDATVELDGETYWRDGRFVFLERPDIQALRAAYPGAEDAFEMRRDIGI